jgi:hypothetical protein
MTVIKLTPKTKKPELKVDYEGTTYTLPGHISASMIEVMMDAQNKEGGDGFLRVFLANVVPKDFKEALAQEDMAELLNLWLGHINGPKDSGSKS